jgi:hypothetical protein
LDDPPALVLEWDPKGRAGSGSLIARRADETIHVDVIVLAKADDRDRFAADLAVKHAGLDREEVAAAILDLAGKVAKRGAADAGSPPRGLGGMYRVVDGRLCRSVGAHDGTQLDVPLCNFAAWITGEVVRDDGVEQSRRLTIEGSLDDGEALPPVEVSTEEFGRSEWPLIHWGPRAVILAGQGVRDHLRAALQLTSGRVPRQTVHTATGWVQLDGVWAYLHAGGAIGPDGPLTSASVDLPPGLAGYILPEPPAGEELALCVRASLGLVRGGLAPDRIILPLLASTYRSTLPDADFSVHLTGRTGTFKTELAALCQQHMGAGLDARHLPGNWSSTANALEVLAFHARDALLVVDDFAPTGSPADIGRSHREADRLLRAQGNRSGRQRLRADGSPRPAKPPRGTILSTGEDVPKGHSIRARMLTLEVGPNDVSTERLTDCQRDAAAGHYAGSMASYLRWLAGRYELARGELKAEAARLRPEFAAALGAEGHRRTPSLVAELQAGFALFLRFATEAGAVDDVEAADLRARCRAALLGVADDQADQQGASDPCDRYLALLGSTLSSGRAHLVAADGSVPDQDHQACGWRRRDQGGGPSTDWEPQGRCIGWVEGGDVYLNPEAAFAEVQRMAGDQGDPITVFPATLTKRLNERGLLARVDGTRKKLQVRKTLGGSRRSVLHLRAANVLGGDPEGPIGPMAPSGPISRSLGPPARAHFTDGPGDVTAPGDRRGGDREPDGPIGPIGPPESAPDAGPADLSNSGWVEGEI